MILRNNANCNQIDRYPNNGMFREGFVEKIGLQMSVTGTEKWKENGRQGHKLTQDLRFGGVSGWLSQ